MALGISLFELARSNGAILLKMNVRNAHIGFALEWFNVALWFTQDSWERRSTGYLDGLLHEAGERNTGVTVE